MVNRFESVTVRRDCPAIIIPGGENVILAKGREVVITQALGGSYTVNDRARLLRVAGENGDALGKPVIKETHVQGENQAGDYNRLEQDRDTGVNFIRLFEQLKSCYDPEIPINIVDLGLIYDVNCYELLDGRYLIRIIMTLTAAGCAMGTILADDIRHKCLTVANVGDVEVNIVYDPPWSYDMISDNAKLELGLL